MKMINKGGTFFYLQIDWVKVGEALPHPVSFPNHSVSLCASALPLDEPGQIPPSEVCDVREGVALDAPINFTAPPQTGDTTSQANCKDTQ